MRKRQAKVGDPTLKEFLYQLRDGLGLRAVLEDQPRAVDSQKALMLSSQWQPVYRGRPSQDETF